MIDAEGLVKAWLVSVAITPKIFLAMPKGDPLPCITLSRVGGGINPRSDLQIHEPRISFQVWSANRPEAKTITAFLVDAIDQVDDYSGMLRVAEVLSVLWLPDPVSDRPRYIVDARFHATAA